MPNFRLISPFWGMDAVFSPYSPAYVQCEPPATPLHGGITHRYDEIGDIASLPTRTTVFPNTRNSAGNEASGTTRSIRTADRADSLGFVHDLHVSAAVALPGNDRQHTGLLDRVIEGKRRSSCLSRYENCFTFSNPS